MITGRIIGPTVERFCLAIIFILVASVTALHAQPYTVDGNGNGTLGSIFSQSPMPFQVASDPTGGITSSPVLIYSLEFPVVSGDVALTNAAGTITDLVRFYTPSGGGNSFLIFYSRTNDPSHMISDVGIPYSANPVKISEQSTTLWDPGSSSQPGYLTGAAPIYAAFKYYIVTVPPGPLSLSGTNLVWKISGATSLAGFQFRVVATTNLSLPRQNWTSVSTNTIDESGNCTVVLPIEPGIPQRFYCLSITIN
jgi:hypothetical protein